MRHPRADGVSHKRRCVLERVRAERLEDIVLKWLQSLIDTPAKLDEITAAYQKHTATEIPGLEGRLKGLEAELRENEKRVQNLISRLAGLPSDVPADPIYARLKDLREKNENLAGTRRSLEAEQKKIVSQTVDRDAFQAKLRTALSTLRTVPENKRRPIYASVLKFAEIYPEKVRLGIFAPARSAHEAPAMAAGAPASAAAAAATPKNTNGTSGLSPRAGSTTVQFGAVDWT